MLKRILVAAAVLGAAYLFVTNIPDMVRYMKIKTM